METVDKNDYSVLLLTLKEDDLTQKEIDELFRSINKIPGVQRSGLSYGNSKNPDLRKFGTIVLTPEANPQEVIDQLTINFRDRISEASTPSPRYLIQPVDRPEKK